MTLPVIALALFAALLHATWNAFLRAGSDRLWTVTVMGLAMVIIAIPFAIVLPLPAAAAWPWIAVSSVLQIGYSYFLVIAYRDGDLGQIYPVVRGSVPVFVTLGGFLLLSERLPVAAILGIGLIVAGIILLTSGKARLSPRALIYALLTGLFIAAYSTVDAIGVRAAGNPAAYAIWIYISYGSALVLSFCLVRGRLRLNLKSRATWVALGGGGVSFIAYGAIVAALSMGPAGPIAALRETSVVFATLIAWAFLDERLTARRVLACAIVAVGAVCVGVAR